MQEVIKDNKQGLVVWNGQQIPRLLLKMIKGAVGKSFVVKHYRDKRGKKKIVVTRFPEMQGVEASDQQRVRRNLFREAVVYAKWIIGEEERKRAFRKTLPLKKRKNVYQAALQLYMRMQGDAQWLRKQLAIRSMMQSGRKDVVVQDQRLDVMKDGGMVNGFIDQRFVEKGFEQQEQWSVWWSEQRLVNKVPFEVVEQDIGQ